MAETGVTDKWDLHLENSLLNVLDLLLSSQQGSKAQCKKCSCTCMHCVSRNAKDLSTLRSTGIPIQTVLILGTSLFLRSPRSWRENVWFVLAKINSEISSQVKSPVSFWKHVQRASHFLACETDTAVSDSGCGSEVPTRVFQFIYETCSYYVITE